MSNSDPTNLDNQLRAVPVDGLKEAVIVIPDISGFTEFVSNTAITHAGHIISELLEAVIDANVLDLELSEIEGDAILFFRFGKVPTAAQINEQAAAMYKAFHNHLLLYETQRICQCGACSSASKLTLKVVAHAGGLSTMHIKGRTKLLGPDVIVAHRLLKNEIDSDEYLLLSDGWEKAEGKWEIGATQYRDVGKVRYRFKELSPLRSELSPPEPIERKFNKINYPISVSQEIKAPLETTYNFVSDIARRPEWFDGLDEVDLSPDPLQRKGAHHLCVINGKQLDVEAYDLTTSESGEITFADRNKRAPVLGEIMALIKLKGEDQGTKVTLELHPQNPGIISRVVFTLGRRWFEKPFRKSLDNLQKIIGSDQNPALH